MPLDITDWKTPASIVATVINNLLPEFVLGVNLFVGYMPAQPANCITVIDSGGGEQDSISKLDTHNIQILARNNNYQLGYNLLNKIKANLQSIGQTLDGDELIVGIWVKSNIGFLEKDESRNSLFTSNYKMIIDTSKDINRTNGPVDVIINGGNAFSFQ